MSDKCNICMNGMRNRMAQVFLIKSLVFMESLRSGISGSGGMQNILGMLENV